MALLTNQGLDDIVRYTLGLTSAFHLVLHLYTNNHTPALADVSGNYTECSLSGYGAVTLTGSSWTGSTSGGLASYTYPTITWTFFANTGSTTIYGVFGTDSDTGHLCFAESFGTNFTVPASGGTLTYVLNWLDSNC